MTLEYANTGGLSRVFPIWPICVNWNESLQPFAERWNPLQAEIFRKFTTGYYWSSFQCEWVTDILFRPGSLVRLETFLLRHGLLNCSSAEVVWFMGAQIGLTGLFQSGSPARSPPV